MARQHAQSRMAPKKIIAIRCRGGNYKYRALSIDHGNFLWTSEHFGGRSKIMEVVYNATNNELVRTKTVVKNAIVQVDATPFKKYYSEQYGIELGKKKVPKEGEEVKKDEKPAEEKKKRSRHALAVVKHRSTGVFIDPHVQEQFTAGRLLACISSRPGQSGRADGYILEGSELQFYIKKMEKKKK